MAAELQLTQQTPAAEATGQIAPAAPPIQQLQLQAALFVEPRELWLGVYLPQLESQQPLLARLALLAQRFTPRVSLEPPDGLLLEVKGSLNLFGGAQRLCRAFRAGCVGRRSAARRGAGPYATCCIGRRACRGFLPGAG